MITKNRLTATEKTIYWLTEQLKQRGMMNHEIIKGIENHHKCRVAKMRQSKLMYKITS